MDELSALIIPIEEVKGIGGKRGAVLKDVGIRTVRDLFYYLPRRYLDRSQILPINQLPVGQEVTLIGSVRQGQFIPGARPRFALVVEDDSDDVTCIWFQGGRYLQRNFKEGDVLALSGKVDTFQGRKQMVHPEFEFVRASGEQELLHTGGIVPLYTSSADMKERGLRSRGFRRLMHGALKEFAERIIDPLSEQTRQRLGLVELQQSVWQVHFPQSMDQVQQARRRLAFDELLALQLRLARVRHERVQRRDGLVLARSERLVPALLESLPFTPTGAQTRVMDEIAADMAKPFVMSRLLQGDVGAGKTLVGLVAILTAVEHGYQAALMAPTDILAEQHYLNLEALTRPLGLETVLLLGRQKAAARRENLQRVESGQAQIVVGTHALIQEEVVYQRLGLAIVDEQHRFGVVQREKLFGKGQAADILVMTATPIPRTLALTVYGDLDVSILDELPPGRKAVRTALRSEDRRRRIFAFVAEQLSQGRQAYVVYPLVEESEKMDLKSAVEGYEEVLYGPLRGFRVGLLHGKMKAEEKSEVMGAFKSGQIQALVSTTVIEVGVDVPNATVMVVEHAERFGLAQLHQLRGRVGRGGDQAYCILVSYAGVDSLAQERLETLCRTNDGFEIAQKDLELRGPGELLGTRQAGTAAFVAADLATDGDLLLLARDEAQRLVGQEQG
jgi:ATP-dependent DNA helicase RecG